ncbi:FAD-dependent oxidoreductase [Thermodesulfobacteriota bacterium]
MEGKHVLVIGGGVAGLTTANALYRDGIKITLVEKEPFLGGHAIQYACKATDQCVKCGACLAEEKLKDAVDNPNIAKWLSTRITSVTQSDRYVVTIETDPIYIDPDKCNGCNACVAACPQDRALIGSYSKNNIPPVALQTERCLNFIGQHCNACQDACRENAIHLKQDKSTRFIEADGVVIAAGFQPFVPTSKPYGYGHFSNVITNLELERMLRQHNQVLKPSDRKPPRKIAFIQCVGSRDAKLNHLWCSKVCCGSSLRMARWIKSRAPQVDIAWFYIDVQTFGKDFQSFYELSQKELQMVRIIPGDILPVEDDQLQLSYFDNNACKGIDDVFDLVVLSIGLLPFEDATRFSDLFGFTCSPSGFLNPSEHGAEPLPKGVFSAGTTMGPMSIPETISSAQQTAWKVLEYLGVNQG